MQVATIRRQKLHELAIAGGIYTRAAKPAKKDYKFMDDVDKILAKTVAKVEKTLESEVRMPARYFLTAACMAYVWSCSGSCYGVLHCSLAKFRMLTAVAIIEGAGEARVYIPTPQEEYENHNVYVHDVHDACTSCRACSILRQGCMMI